MEPFEQLGAFYLGRPYDLEARKPLEGLVLYDSQDLVTHAVCVGMTGSGKTGLCLALIEEALLDGVPVLAIDPKGDLGNLCLTFPNLSTGEFAPWINAEDAPAPARRPTSSRRHRRTRGARASPAGARTRRASGACAMPPRSRSTRPEATPACRWRCSARSQRRRTAAIPRHCATP